MLRYFYKDYLIPITYDNLHHKCNPCVWDLDNTWHTTSEEVALSPMELCANSWGIIRPLFHYSESHPDKTNPRSHADMPTDLPASDLYDWDVELKAKDKAIREFAMIKLVRQSEEMGLYDTQMSVANKVMDEDREVLKGLKKGIVDIV